MSIFDTTYSNSLDIRTRSTKTDSLLVLNPITGQYEHLTPNGEGQGTSLPYYIGNESIQFENSPVLNGSFVNEVDEALNGILPAHEASLEELDTRMAAAEGVNTTQAVSITALQGKTANVVQSGSIALNLGYSSTVSNRALINNNGLNVYSGTLTTVAPYPHVRVDPTKITMAKNTGSVYLDYDRVDNIAKLASVTTIDFNDKMNFTKGVTLPGVAESVDTTNKKMIVMDATTKSLSFAAIPSGGGATAKVLDHTPSLGGSTTIFKDPGYNSSNPSGAFVGDIDDVRKYNMNGVTTAVLDLKEAGDAFDIPTGSSRTQVLTFFKDDAIYDVANGTVISEKLNLAISYLPGKNDANSNLMNVSLKPFAVSKLGQWALGRLIIIERIGSGSGPEIRLRGKFIITNHILTGMFGEMTYGWTE